MTIYLISYSTKKFRLSQLLLAYSAKLFGCDKVINYVEDDLIQSDFYRKNRGILDQKKGAGYWLWKYYFINEALSGAQKDDVIIYADAGLFFKKRVKPLIDILKNKTHGVLLFHNNYLNRYWTKRDCFIGLLCDEEQYHNSPIIFGGLQIFQKNDFTNDFVNEVLHKSCMDNIITDSENKFGKPNLDGFIEHRHDQSVVSLLAHKRSICLYSDPSQFNTKNITYNFPIETALVSLPYSGIVYVHRLTGFKLFLLPFSILIRKKWF